MIMGGSITDITKVTTLYMLSKKSLKNKGEIRLYNLSCKYVNRELSKEDGIFEKTMVSHRISPKVVIIMGIPYFLEVMILSMERILLL